MQPILHDGLGAAHDKKVNGDMRTSGLIVGCATWHEWMCVLISLLLINKRNGKVNAPNARV